MGYPVSINKNNYYDNVKDSTVFTPLALSYFLYNIISEKYGDYNKTIIDPCVGSGNLLIPWIEKNNTLIGYDVNNYVLPTKHIEFFQSNFVEDPLEVPGYVDFVLCNPPFNKDLKNSSKKRAFVPELFLDRIFSIWGEETKVVLFTPMGFRLNQRIKSNRWKKIRDNKAKITSIISLPLDVFNNTELHQEIIIFNADQLESHYFLDDTTIEKLDKEIKVS